MAKPYPVCLIQARASSKCNHCAQASGKRATQFLLLAVRMISLQKALAFAYSRLYVHSTWVLVVKFGLLILATTNGKTTSE